MIHLRGVVACAIALGGATASAQIFGVELVQNGGAEAGPFSPDGNQPVAAIPGWSVNGVNVVRYGTGNFPSQASPGPQNRGLQFFTGGNNNPFANASQVISLASGAAGIDTGQVTYTLSAWLGGFGSENDLAQVAVVFNDAAGQSLATATIVGPFAVERGNITGLQERTGAGLVPVGTRSATVIVSMVRTTGTYNHGYADNISLILGAPPPTCDPDFNEDGNADQDDVACLAQVVAGDPACSDRDPDFNGDGNVDQDDIDALAQVVAGAPCP
jgi:hypothetical protein